MFIRSFVLFLFCLSLSAQSRRVGRYEVTLRPPADGLYSDGEMQLEFRIADATQPDPLMGFAPVVRAEVRATIQMPAMPGMSKIEEIAHPEGVPGDYGLHPTFAHGGEYKLVMSIKPPGGEPFTVDFALDVKDPDPSRAKRPAPKPFRLEFAANPKRPRTGETVEMRLRIFAVPNPDNPNAATIDPKRALTEFDINHEKQLHLIVVHSTGFLPFAHLHPEFQPDGTFVVRHAFTAPGDYTVFADVAPRGAGAQVLQTKLTVTGKALPFRAPTDPPIIVNLASQVLPARKTTTLAVTVRDPATSQPITNLEPYLGAMGHLILVAEDGVTFVHSHPDERIAGAGRDGTIPFLVRPPKPGRYNGMVEVQRNGKVERNSFVVEAR